MFILLLLVFGMLLLRVFFVTVLVKGYSMYPTISPNDRLLIIKYLPKSLYRNGQIVMCRYPILLPHEIDSIAIDGNFYIKRIVGLPFDTVRANCGYSEEKQCWYSVPENKCFLQGDNTMESVDSTSWGALPFESLVGIVICHWSTGKELPIHKIKG